MEIPTAEAGEKVVFVDVPGVGKRLQVIGSEPAVYRRIDIDRGPTLRINDGPEMSPTWLLEANDFMVRIPGERDAFYFDKVPYGTRVEVVGYRYTTEESAANQARERASHRDSGQGPHFGWL